MNRQIAIIHLGYIINPLIIQLCGKEEATTRCNCVRGFITLIGNQSPTGKSIALIHKYIVTLGLPKYPRGI